MTASGTAPRDPAAPTPPRGWRPTWHTVAVLAVAYWLYVVNGVLNSEVGPVLLGMVQSFRVDLATAGTIFTAQFLGYLLGASGSGVAADRWGYQRVMVLAALLTAVGTAGTAIAGTWLAVLALTAVAGAGFGVTDSLCNAVVAAQVPSKGGGALNLLHTFFGVGALLGPLLAGLVLATPAGWRTMFVLTGALSLSCAVFVIVARIPPPAHLAVPRGTRAATNAGGGSPVPAVAPGRARSGRLWLLVGLLFLFVGMEQLTGGWSTPYLNRALGAHLDVAARSVALYWAAVTVGRLLASALAVRVSNERLLGGSAIVALAALTALALADAVGPALFALTAVGLGFAPIYPTVMAIAARVPSPIRDASWSHHRGRGPGRRTLPVARRACGPGVGPACDHLAGSRHRVDPATPVRRVPESRRAARVWLIEYRHRERQSLTASSTSLTRCAHHAPANPRT